MPAFEAWRGKEDPRWLLSLSQSEIGGKGVGHADFSRLTKYIEQFASRDLPSVDSPKFLEKFDSGHHEFLSMLKKEAAAYHAVFNSEPSPKPDVYSAELISQVKHAYGAKTVKSIEGKSLNAETAGNLMVAAAIAAIRDMALVEQLHKFGKIDEVERKFGLDEINQRMNKAGINGIDSLFAARPELERFIERDTTVIDVSHLPGHAKNDKMTRAAFYNKDKSHAKGFPPSSGLSVFVHPLTLLRENAIGTDFPELEKKKDTYIAAHAKEVSPLSSEIAKKFAAFRDKGDPIDFAHPDTIKPIAAAADKGNYLARDEYVQFLLHEGVAINHPDSGKYADSLRLRKSGIIEGDVTDAKLAQVVTESRLSDASGTRRDTPINAKRSQHTPRATDVTDVELDSKTGKYSAKAQPKEEDKNTAAKIATLGGATAVGLLMATGRNKDKESGTDEKPKSNHNVTRFVALATAAAISVGGAVMWSRKPEFLYKPTKNLINSLSGGLSK